MLPLQLLLLLPLLLLLSLLAAASNAQTGVRDAAVAATVEESSRNGRTIRMSACGSMSESASIAQKSGVWQ